MAAPVSGAGESGDVSEREITLLVAGMIYALKLQDARNGNGLCGGEERESVRFAFDLVKAFKAYERERILGHE